MGLEGRSWSVGGGDELLRGAGTGLGEISEGSASLLCNTVGFLSGSFCSGVGSVSPAASPNTVGGGGLGGAFSGSFSPVSGGGVVAGVCCSSED